MIESYIGLVLGVLVAFFCMIFYRRGLKDGIQLTQKKVEPIMPKPEFLKTPAEKEQDKEAAEKRKVEDQLEKELNALFSYQPGKGEQR